MADQDSKDNQHFFYEDEVYRITKNGKVCLGMVMENFEANFSDQDSDSDIPPTLPPIKKGELRVTWHPSGREEVVKDDTVGLADRSLMPGDVVRRMIKGKDTQRGYCREINVEVAAQICGTPYVISNIPSERLKTLEEFASDLAVCLDSWVGSTRSINYHMTLTSSDGSKLQWNDFYSCPFEEYNSSRSRFESCETSRMYYPGQTVVSSLKALDAADWVHCTKEMTALRKRKHKEHKFVIQSIEIESVTVRWQCKALSFENEGGHEGAHTQPKAVITGDDLKRLKLLNLYEPCTVSVCDRYYLTITEEDVIVNLTDWRKQQSREFKELHRTKSNAKTEDINRKPPPLTLDCDDAPDSVDAAKPIVVTIGDDILVENDVEKSSDVVNNMDIGDVEPPGAEPAANNLEVNSDDDWLTDSSSESLATQSSSVSNDSMKRVKKSPVLSTKLLKGKKLKRTRRKTQIPQLPKPGDKVVVEVLSTRSKGNVVWQDGSIENGIASINLYPIHHLDDQEFFPGDFVIAGAEGADPPCLREYGVVQSMDHQGRTALVKWFRTYTSTQEPRPAFLSESEVSVYDLKDHPDFQYRPATIVIRVANFVGEDSICTAGQVIDNFPEGKVKVWWVDGHSSMCWPQDIFKIGEYDSEDGDFWADNASDDSWETQSEESVTGTGGGGTGGSSVGIQCPLPELKPRLAANVERARTAMARLEEIFTQNPSLQSQEVMRKLLDVYKECRYLDRLMDTSFFHEDHFQGLLERVREKGTASAAKQIQDHMSRLFSNEFAENALDMNLSNISNEEVLIESTDLENNPSSKTETKHRDSKHCLETRSSSKTSITKDEWNKKKTSKIAARSSSSTVQNQVAKSNSITDTPQKNSKSSISDNSINKNEINRSSKCDIPPVPNNSLKDVKISDNDEVKASLDTVKLVIQRMNVEQIKAEGNGESAADVNEAADAASDANDKDQLKIDEIHVASAQKSSADVTVLLHSTSPNALDRSQTKTEDSGLFSHSTRASMGSTESYPSSTEYLVSDVVGSLANQVLDTIEHELEGKKVENQLSVLSPGRPLSQSDSSSAHHVCVRLCSLIKAQLVAAHAEIIRRYGIPTPSLTEIVTDANQEEDAQIMKELCAVLQSPCTPLSPASISDVSLNKSQAAAAAAMEETMEQFSVCDSAPSSHNYYLTMLQPTNPPEFFRTVRKELKLLRGGLPPGVWVKNYEDRMDLFSVLIRGPDNTPYEDGLFLFDFQLPAEYPKTPPLCHYISYCYDRLNPNLYEDGKVCVSLLGTWSGKGTEVWGSCSTLLQVLVSIQGLILVPEPYFNEAGYDKQKGSQSGCENSRMYNEMVVLKLVQATTKLLRSPPEVFRDEIMSHFKQRAPALLNRLENWLALSEAHNVKYPTSPMTPSTYRVKELAQEDASILDLVPPDFPLIPASKGFCLSLRSALDSFKEILKGLT